MDPHREEEKEPRTPQVDASRRAFLRTAIAAGVAAAAGELWRTNRADGLREGTSFTLEGAQTLEIGQAMEFAVPNTDVKGLVVRTTDGLLAVDRRCPHLGCPVLWSPEAARFECPCHRAAFDGRTGDVLHGPPQTGLRRLAVEERGSGILLRA